MVSILKQFENLIKQKLSFNRFSVFKAVKRGGGAFIVLNSFPLIGGTNKRIKN